MVSAVRHRSCFFAVLLGVSLLAGPVRAEPTPEEQITKGLELRSVGRDEEALSLFRAADARAPSPRGRAQIALAEQALGMWVAAEIDLEAALAFASDPWIAKHATALEGALAVIRRHLGSLEVRGADGAEVQVDGVDVGRVVAGQPFRLEAGRRAVEIRSPGMHTLTREIDVPAGGVARTTVKLAPVDVAPESPVGTPGTSRAPETRQASAATGNLQRALGWTFTGTGAVALGGALAALLIHNQTVYTYNDDCLATPPVRTPASCADLLDKKTTWESVGIATVVAGGALTVVGVALLLTAPSSSSGDGRPAASLACGPFGCVGRF